VVRDADTGDVLAERYASLGSATNNVAEYAGLIAGLTAAAELGAREVDVQMDSKLVVEQMSGRWQIKHPGLRPLAAEAAALVARFERVRFGWIPRERNRHADALANQAMDEALGVPPKAPEPAAAAAPPPRPAAPAAAGPASWQQAPPPSWDPPTSEPTRFVMVRHGETERTADRRYSGHDDVPLSERGQAQAQAVARRVAGLDGPVTAIVSSPLFRCTATAGHVSAALGGVPVLIEDDLIECDFGLWEGLTFADVRERWPDELGKWLASTSVAPPEGESLRSVSIRARRALGRLRAKYAGQQVVLVSHVSPIKVILRDALGAGDELLYRLYLDPAGLSIVDFFTDGGIAVRTVNDTAHLVGI
jgi:probable phosphoglycerate mutase